ncbi:MAG: type I methionyl aminopeptidase [Deltaproteobacteria bacterium]|jgi:methionyl aminopeptidase|nr:type I methionyl aminopeptidase [Deltaproteobacteria bacterium]
MIILKTKQEIEQLRVCNRIVARTLKELKNAVIPGITTRELNDLAEHSIREQGAVPAFIGYRGFPASLCTSINEQIVHAIPGDRKLKEGDIISLDVGAKLNDFFGDAAVTLPVGEIGSRAKELLRVAEEALYKGIEQAVAGNKLSDISQTIQVWAESHGFSVVRDFVGHGIGKSLHEEPQIPNFGTPVPNPRLQEGMVFALEPMINEGTYEVKLLPDGWTAATADGKLSAHFEHVIAINGDGPIVLSEC